MPAPVINEDLDVLGTTVIKNLYTQICSCYSLPDDSASARSAVTATLIKGLERLSSSFPWIAGQVIDEGGVFKIQSREKIPRFVVKDSGNSNDSSMPTMDALRNAHFPFSMLDESVICPRNTLPDGTETEAPVFLVQVTFIAGGLILTFVGQHNAMDMTGQGQVIHLLSKACRDEPFTSEELSWGNRPRRDLIPLLEDDYKPGPELDYQVVKPNAPDPLSTGASTDLPEPVSTPAKCKWAYFIFSPASLSAVKSSAVEKGTLPPGSYISTDDALTAFIWQSISRARLHRIPPSAETTLARAVDVRSYLNIPQTYPGLVNNMTYHTCTLQRLGSESLGSIASTLRSALDTKAPRNLGYATRALATILTRSPGYKDRISSTATIDLQKDVMLSSWSKVSSYELDFGLGLGKPEVVRRPQFVPVESLGYLMPKRGDGEVAVGICLREEDLEALRRDDEWTRWAMYVG